MRVDAFHFELPAELIAQRPVEPRDAARLLRVTPAAISHRRVRDLPDLLRPGDLLVFNDTRVIPARLSAMRGETRVSVTLHQAVAPDRWRVFAKPGKRLRPGDRIVFGADFSALVLEKRAEGDIELQFDRGGDALMTALHAHGQIPLPPYIRGGIADARDETDYQTLFARAEGAVAAPTAALHFTDELLTALRQRGIEQMQLTLHVGAGTFLPVKVADTEAHVMHEEWGKLSADCAERIAKTRANGGRIIAVGTTSLRLLESAADDQDRVRPFEGTTRLFITPGYRFKVVDLLMTNFHLPKSTLFMLVAAFAGLERMHEAYAEARARGYRFYSYGDSSLLDRAAP